MPSITSTTAKITKSQFKDSNEYTGIKLLKDKVIAANETISIAPIRYGPTPYTGK